MPSKFLAALPSTLSPIALSAQTAHSRQILTPPFSFTSALLLHSFAVRGKSCRLFPTACALFAKKTGVYPSRSFRVFTIPLLTALDSILTETRPCKSYRRTGVGGRGRLTRLSFSGLHAASPRFSCRLPARPRTCTLSPATGRNNHDRSA